MDIFEDIENALAVHIVGSRWTPTKLYVGEDQMVELIKYAGLSSRFSGEREIATLMGLYIVEVKFGSYLAVG